MDLFLHLHRTSLADLIVYMNADWAGYLAHLQIHVDAVFLEDNPISLSSKRQPTVSWSSAEAEYRAVANGVTEAC
jgi:hypothetical protein